MMINKKNKGSLSVDFMIGISVSCLLLVFVILMTLTFSLVEVAQYVAYATAREYFIGHTSYPEHEDMARDKYDALNVKFFKKGSGDDLSNWFFLTPQDKNDLVFYNGQNTGLNSNNPTKFGAGFIFTSKVMTMEIPFLGNVGGSSGGSGGSGGSSSDGFEFPIAAFLGREVSRDECSRLVLNNGRSNFVLGDFVSGGNGC